VTDAIAILNGQSAELPCTHLDYPVAETAKAAAFLQPFLPPPTAPDTPGNVTAVATSQLGINDNSFSGNSGSWNVKIKLGGLP